MYFLGRQCAFVFPIYVWKYRKYAIDRWIVVYTVCASVVMSPLRQWLDSYPKTCLKMSHTFKHFIHMQYFLLLTNLVILFVHWVSTGVLYEPRQCSLFWDYIHESILCFCVNLCCPSVRHSIRPIQKLLNCQTTTCGGCHSAPFIPMGSNQKQRCGSEFTKWHDIYTPEECVDEWRQNNVDLKLLENCVIYGFIMFGIMLMTATGLANSPVIWRLHCFTVSLHGDVCGDYDPRELASVNWKTLQWACGQFTRTIIPDWLKWHDIKFWYMCWLCNTLDLFPLLMMHKTCSINYGHLADLQKSLLANIKPFLW